MNGEPLIKIGPIAIECLMAVPFFFLAWASFFNNSRLKVMASCGFVLIFFVSILNCINSFNNFYLYHDGIRYALVE